MADVTDRRDRGQMIIITALVIAVLFVGLALILNSAIYTENLSTRETGEQSSAILQERHTIEQDLQFQIDRANEQILDGEADYEGASTAFRNSVSVYGESRANEMALAGRILALQRVDQTEGTQIRQQTDGNFTAGGDIESEPDWKLVNNTTEAGTFEMDVQRTSLLNISNGLVDDDTELNYLLDAAFHVKISNGTEEWRIIVYQGVSGNINVLTESGERSDIIDRTLDTVTAEKCSVDADRAEIDLTAGTIAGEQCAELEFYKSEVVGDEHDIEFRNARTDLDALGLLDILDNPYLDSPTEGDRVTGTYDLVVNRPVDNLDDDPYYDPDAGEPSSQSILYDASIDLVYRNAGTMLVVEDHEIKWTKVKP